MEALDLSGLPEQPLLLLDTAAIIYCLEDNAEFGPRFQPLFEAHRKGDLRFAVTTITLAEVLTGPLQSGDEALTRRYRAILESWQIVDLTAHHPLAFKDIRRGERIAKNRLEFRPRIDSP